MPEQNNLLLYKIEQWVQAQKTQNGRAYSAFEYDGQRALLEMIDGFTEIYDHLRATTGKKETFVRQNDGRLRIVLVDDLPVCAGSSSIGTERVPSEV